MYESFFGFTQRPFLAMPRTDRYYPGEAIESARQHLVRCIDRAEGCGLIVGPAGTGKTLLCQVLAEQFQDRMDPVLLSGVRLTTRKSLLQAILYELDMPYRRMEEGELRLSLIDRLAPTETCPEGMLLLVDEAHSLSARLFEELRMLTNLVRGGSQRVRLVMAGNAVLEERFAHPRMESFNQRLVARCYLERFSAAESTEFVRAQTAATGVDPDQVWTDESLRAIHHATDGCPRLINQVCDHALILEGAAQNHTISGQAVEEAWAELQQLPTPWNGDPPDHADGGSAANASDGSAVIEFGSLDGDDDELQRDVTDVSNEHQFTDLENESVGDEVDAGTQTVDFAEAEEVEFTEAEENEDNVPVGESFAESDGGDEGQAEQEVIDFKSGSTPEPETHLNHIEFHLADAQNAFDESDEASHVELFFNDVTPTGDDPQEQVVIDDFVGLSCDYAVHLSPQVTPLAEDDDSTHEEPASDSSLDVPRDSSQPTLNQSSAAGDSFTNIDQGDASYEEEPGEYQEDDDHSVDMAFDIGNFSQAFDLASHSDPQTGEADDDAEVAWRHLAPESDAAVPEVEYATEFDSENESSPSASADETPGNRAAELELAAVDAAVDADVAGSDVAESDAAEADIAETDIAETDIAETDAAEADIAESDAAESDAAESLVAGSEVAESDVAGEDGTESAATEPVVSQHPTIPVRQREYRRLFAMLYDSDRQAGPTETGASTGEV